MAASVPEYSHARTEYAGHVRDDNEQIELGRHELLAATGDRCSDHATLAMMQNGGDSGPISRRQLLRMIGVTTGNAAMYQAMSSLGFAAESPFKGPIDLQGAPRDASVLILGAGVAGMAAAYELRNAGYRVQILEYNARAGGRNWSLRGGDTYTELGGLTQHCQFDQDLYINPRPWRIPYHHRRILRYCKRLGVPL